MQQAEFTIAKLIRLVAVLTAFVFAFAGVASAETRIALVIGNGDYKAGSLPRLTNAPNDARLMDATLSDLGFKVTRVADATQQQMQRAILDFGKALKAAGPDAVGLFYYSGHGVQSDGLNYMVPVDAEVETVQDVQAVAPRMGLVLTQFRSAGNKTNFIILDACRNNSLPSESKGSDRGLTPEPVSGSSNVFIAYATQPGAVAADGKGANSPYTEALARLMKSDTVPAVNMFIHVGDAVREATHNRQQPWTENGAQGDTFCFAACTSPTAIVDQRESVFDQADANHDGSLSVEEYKMTQPSLTEAQLRSFFGFRDVDGDGKLTKREYSAARISPF